MKIGVKLTETYWDYSTNDPFGHFSSSIYFHMCESYYIDPWFIPASTRCHVESFNHLWDVLDFEVRYRILWLLDLVDNDPFWSIPFVYVFPGILGICKNNYIQLVPKSTWQACTGEPGMDLFFLAWERGSGERWWESKFSSQMAPAKGHGNRMAIDLPTILVDWFCKFQYAWVEPGWSEHSTSTEIITLRVSTLFGLWMIVLLRCPGMNYEIENSFAGIQWDKGSDGIHTYVRMYL